MKTSKLMTCPKHKSELLEACKVTLQGIKNAKLYHRLKVSIVHLEDAITKAEGR